MLICRDVRTGHGCGTANTDRSTYCTNCNKSLKYALTTRNPNSRVGQYNIEETIGYGGFGVVYKATDTLSLGRIVALKETSDPDDTRSFAAEFQKLSLLDHPNLPCYYATFEAEGSGFLVMEYIPGKSLEQVIQGQQGFLLEGQVLGYTLQICDALHYLHSQRQPLFHRDIKPANIRLTAEGLVKLVDFGLLKQGTQQTQSSRRGFTPAYAPPEQWGIGKQSTDARSDIYSLGATLYHLLTGQEPPSAADRIAGSYDPLAPIQSINSSISDHVSAAVAKAMHINISERYSDVPSFRNALYRSAGGEMQEKGAQVATAINSRYGALPTVYPKALSQTPVKSPATGATIALDEHSHSATPRIPTAVGQINISAHKEPVIPGVSIRGWILVVSAIILWGLAITMPLAMLFGWIITGYAIYQVAWEKGYNPSVRAWLSLPLFVFGPFLLIDTLVNRPKGALTPLRPNYRPRLTLALAVGGLALTPLVQQPGNVLLIGYCWALIAEYIFVSKGWPSRLMLLLAVPVVTGPIAVLIAWMAPIKRAAKVSRP